MAKRKDQYKNVAEGTNVTHEELAKKHIDHIISRAEENEPIYIWLGKLSDGLYLTEADVKNCVAEYGKQVVASYYNGTCILVE